MEEEGEEKVRSFRRFFLNSNAQILGSYVRRAHGTVTR